MVISFKHKNLQNLYSTEGLPKKYPTGVIKAYRKRIDILTNSSNLKQISSFKGLKLKKLSTALLKGSYSIRINDQYRIIFASKGKGKLEITELSKHYE